MWEDLIVWLIIVVAGLYAGRNIYRIFSGKANGCSCEGGCDATPTQQTIPDFKKPAAKP